LDKNKRIYHDINIILKFGDNFVYRGYVHNMYIIRELLIDEIEIYKELFVEKAAYNEIYFMDIKD
jgi:hypothetical protein